MPREGGVGDHRTGSRSPAFRRGWGGGRGRGRGGRCRGGGVWGTTGQDHGVPPFGGRGEEDWTGLGGTYAEWVLKNNVHRIFSGVRTSPGKHPVLPGKWTREDEDAYPLVPVQGAGGFRGRLAVCSRENRRYHKRAAERVKRILAIMRMGISHALHIETLEE